MSSSLHSPIPVLTYGVMLGAGSPSISSGLPVMWRAGSSVPVKDFWGKPSICAPRPAAFSGVTSFAADL